MEIKITVERVRGSVTQGMAYVLINGVKIIGFGDTIELLQPGDKYYGENIDGWASKKPDTDFIIGLLFSPHNDIYHYSDFAKAAMDSLKKQEEKNAQTYKKVKLVRYVATDDWGREVFMDEHGKVWKYTEPGGMPRERHDALYSSTGNNIYGEPDCPMKSNIDYKIVEESL